MTPEVPPSQSELAKHRGPDDPPMVPFRIRSQSALADEHLQEVMLRSRRLFQAGQQMAQSDPSMAHLRRRGRDIRTAGVADLSEHLRELEAALTNLGVHVHHAADAAEARRIVTSIAKSAEITLAVKSKSMATEEIFLTDALENEGIEVVETDLGEFIIQLANERPAHILAPALHKDRHEIRGLLATASGTDVGDRREDLTLRAGEILREKFLSAGMGVTGANFAAADTGTLAAVSNEGNLRLTSTLPRVHVAVVPIDKVVANFSDLAILLPLLTRSATGQPLTSYVSLLTGPRRESESDGPRESHVVLLDNGRRRMIGTEYKSMLRCIRCAACIAVCPVYGKTGGHAYDGAYSGPMGAVLGSLLDGGHPSELPFASTLCGACTDACPAGIPLHELLYSLRRDSEAARPSASRSGAFAAWSMVWSNPFGYRAWSSVTALARRLSDFAADSWNDAPYTVSTDGSWITGLPGRASSITDERALPMPAPETFQQWWRRPHPSQPDAADKPNPDPPERVRRSGPPAKENGLDEMAEDNRPVEDPTTPLAPPRPESQEAATEVLIANMRRNGFEVVDARGADPVLPIASLVGEAGGLVVVDDIEELDIIKQALDDAEVRLAAADRESISSAAVGITGVHSAIAETGTIVMTNRAGNARTISLLPRVHIAWLRTPQVVMTMSDALARIAAQRLPSGTVLISGPSKTGDIELVMTTGVHGPGRVIVVISD